MSDRSPGGLRDPAFIRASVPFFEWMLERYHTFSIDGVEHLPEGRALIVGNHNGGIVAPDMFALMLTFWRRFGVERPAYGLMHDFACRFPVTGKFTMRLGGVAAHPANAIRLLERDAPVLVYPGGALDAFRPSSRRNKVVFSGRSGFVRVALRSRAPIIPVVAAGAHDGFHIFTDGSAFAERTGLKKHTRIEVVPIIAGLPWGVYVGPGWYWPLPVRMKLRILPPMTWPELGPEHANDDAIVARCAEQVRVRMQQTLDTLVAEGGSGSRLLGGRLGRAIISRLGG